MKRRDFFYELPPERIAQHPPARRGDSRLLHLPARGTPAHLAFADLPSLLRPGDLLVRNDTRVLPARLLGRSAATGSPVEVLLLKRLRADDWEVLVKPGKRARTGMRVAFPATAGADARLEAEVLDVLDTGNRVVRFAYEGVWEAVLDAVGTMPLPPYIHERLDDPARYQTVYAAADGSAAAPTAGLHFTPEMLARLEGMGVRIADVTLHVGLGTFRPVKADDLRDHVMHAEWYDLPEATARAVADTRAAGGRIVAVGTTACRVLETAARPDGTVAAGSGWTDLFLLPGSRFHAVDLLLTNFHLPESTLLMLVSAFSGTERILAAYREAIDREYRFFSFGDAMLLERAGPDAPPDGEGKESRP